MVALVAVVAALIDRRSGRIPDVLTVPAMVIGMTLGGWPSLVAALVCAGWSMQLEGIHVGGGDAKLLAALASIHPAVGLVVTLLLPVMVAGRISMRAAPAIAVWTAIFSCCLAVR